MGGDVARQPVPSRSKSWSLPAGEFQVGAIDTASWAIEESSARSGLLRRSRKSVTVFDAFILS
jgi:hypothetical protein